MRLLQKAAKLFDVECGTYLLKKLALLVKIYISNLNFAGSELSNPSTYVLFFKISNTTLFIFTKKVSGMRLDQKTAKLFDVECGLGLLKKLEPFLNFHFKP